MNTTCQQPLIEEPSLLELVLSALEATGRLKSQPPAPDLPPHFNRDNLLELHLDERPDGWVANIEFREVPPGAPNCIGTPDRFPFEDPSEAFLAGAAIVCQIATSSPDLPFFVSGDQLICVAYGA